MTSYLFCNILNVRFVYCNKYNFRSLEKAADLIEHNGYNGCHFCLPRYDTDTLTEQKVLENLNVDIT